MSLYQKFTELKREERQRILFRLVLCVFILTIVPHPHGGQYFTAGGGIGGNPLLDLLRIGLYFWGGVEVLCYITIGWWIKREKPEFHGL